MDETTRIASRTDWRSPSSLECIHPIHMIDTILNHTFGSAIDRACAAEQHESSRLSPDSP